jgi:hypothetical protein
MNEVNQGDLLAVKQIYEKRLEFLERSLRLAPLHEAMKKSIELTVTKRIPELLAGPQEMRLQAILSLEASNANFEEKQHQAETRMKNFKDCDQQKTAALREWLEALG